MDDRTTHFRLGLLVVVLASVLMTLCMVYLFGELSFAGQKTLYVRFSNVSGVSQDSPVRKNGILIGRVRNITPVTKGVVLTLSIQPRWKLFSNEMCRIGSDNLFGDAVIEFIDGGTTGTTQRELSDGEYMNGFADSDPMDAMRVVVDMKEEFEQALTAIRVAGEEVGGVAEQLGEVVTQNHDQFGRILGETERVLGRFDTVMVSINQVVGDEDLQYALEDALEGIPSLIANANSLVQGVQRVLDQAETNLVNLRGITEPLGKQGDSIVQKLDSSAGRLDELLLEFRTFGEKLNDGEGSVSKLVYSPDIYQNLNRAAQNLEELTRRLEPIVSDVGVFADKVARNPRMVGGQGIFHKRTSGIK